MRLMSGSAAPRDSTVPDAVAMRRRGRLPRRHWRTWLGPAAIAVAVAVAVTLVAVRNAAPPAASATGVPEYYVALPPVPELGFFSSASRAVVGDTLTGKRVATVPAPAGRGFADVTAAGDDRTFVLSVAPRSSSQQPMPFRWYLLRLTPGAARPAALRQFPIPPQSLYGGAFSMALSPDGTMLAIATEPHPPLTQLRVYSTASGALLHTWSTQSPESQGIGTVRPVSWTGGGHQLTFQTTTSTGSVIVRLLPADDQGHDLLADSRPVFSFTAGLGSPHNCTDGFLMAGNGRTAVCGAAAQVRGTASFAGSKACPSETHPYGTAIRQASAVTGKFTGTLYQFGVFCQMLGDLALSWVNDAGTAMLGYFGYSPAGHSRSPLRTIGQFGLFTRGKFTPLPAPLEGFQWQSSSTAW